MAVDSSPAETNDLIYEGIATVPGTFVIKFPRRDTETNDLIYEGIATSVVIIIMFLIFETNDLIYEGIATIAFLFTSFHHAKSKQTT